MYCPDIHHNLSVQYRNQEVNVAPCCQAKYSKVVNNQLVDHPRLIEIRDLSKQEISTDDCSTCIVQEKSGGQSRRQNQQGYYEGWEKSGIRGLDIDIGNLCNLKCVICGAYSSTSWIDDYQKLGGKVLDSWKYNKKDQYNIDWLADFKDLEIVHFTGGEPLLGNTHVDFLNKLNERDILKNCRITYNTNATQLPSRGAIELWQQAKVIELYFSIDDIKNRFEYQRTGAQWSEVQKNLNYFYNMDTTNHLFHFNITWSYLNLYYLPDLIDWIKDTLPANRFGDDVYIHLQKGTGNCQVDHLTQDQYNLLVDRFKGYVDLEHIINAISISDKKPIQFINYIEKLDNIRNSNYADVHEEWAKVIFNDKYYH